MRLSEKPRGFALPAVLVVASALLILAVGAMLVVGIERNTARSFVDRERAELAARAGLEHVRGILTAETANDDFIVIQSTLDNPIVQGADPAPHLFIARGKEIAAGADTFDFRYIPLFSTTDRPDDGPFKAPEIDALTGAANEHIDFHTLPWLDKARAAWLPVRDGKGRVVARYAYWVEDLQGRVDPAIAGNDKGENGSHARAAWPFPAPGLNDQPEAGDEPALDQIALFALDPAATDTAQGDLGKTLLENRKLLVSPDSQLAAAGIQPPLDRLTAASADGGFTGDLTDPKARAVERGLATNLQPYLERPLIPHAAGIDPAAAGEPKLNLNRLLADDRDSAVAEMAAHIKRALPDFENRKGGFPDDYLKTLAANALDYADQDNDATVGDGYRGIDAYPFATEIVLKVDYRRMTVSDGRQFLNFNIRLFGELFNPTDVEISGSARLSYEVALNVSPIGSGTGSPAFDSPALLDRAEYSTHDLDRLGDIYWSKPQPVNLRPGEYKCYMFAEVTYRLDQGTLHENPIASNTPFSLLEKKAESGVSLMWNDVVVERQQGLVRQQGFIYGVTNGRKTGGYLVGSADILSKAHYPALLYQKPFSSAFYGNTGDPRISHYLNRDNASPLDESAYPQNSSPNRRALRLGIYKNDAPSKPKVYARMLPSEWPDGGHDMPVGAWSPGSSDATEITDPKFDIAYDPDAQYHAIQRISNRGYFLSPTELGHVFDPIMFAPVFDTSAATGSFWSRHVFPAGADRWPDAKTTVPNPRNSLYGGGNTLRIGRPEHAAFNGIDGKYNRASALLDLFHAGQPLAAGSELKAGPLVKIDGHVNLNTASRDALRLLAAGHLVMDPLLAKRTDTAHAVSPAAAPPSVNIQLGAPSQDSLADKIADAVIAGRPYSTASMMAAVTDSDGSEVFGNRMQYPEADDLRWTDSAAEEVFARIHQASTVRSRNFRVWIVAQALSPAESLSSSTRVLAEVRRVHTLFADPGSRSPDGALIRGNARTKILTTNEF